MSYVPTTPPAGDEIFLLKMGEMVLKGLNRRTFEERLMGNARRRLQKYGKFRIYSRQSITYIEPKEPGCDMDGAFDTLSRLFGVVGLSRAKGLRENPRGHSGDRQDLPPGGPAGRPDLQGGVQALGQDLPHDLHPAVPVCGGGA